MYHHQHGNLQDTSFLRYTPTEFSISISSVAEEKEEKTKNTILGWGERVKGSRKTKPKTKAKANCTQNTQQNITEKAKGQSRCNDSERSARLVVNEQRKETKGEKFGRSV